MKNRTEDNNDPKQQHGAEPLLFTASAELSKCEMKFTAARRLISSRLMTRTKTGGGDGTVCTRMCVCVRELPPAAVLQVSAGLAAGWPASARRLLEEFGHAAAAWPQAPASPAAPSSAAPPPFSAQGGREGEEKKGEKRVSNQSKRRAAGRGAISTSSGNIFSEVLRRCGVMGRQGVQKDLVQ